MYVVLHHMYVALHHFLQKDGHQHRAQGQKVIICMIMKKCFIIIFLLTVFCVFQLQVAFMPYRVNGQYIKEGLASSFLFSKGGLGFIILDKSNAVGMSKLNGFLLLILGFVCVLVSFFTCRVFMRMKLP